MDGKTSRPAVGPRGRLKTSELPAHVARLRALGLFPQARRARLIGLLIDSQGFTVAGFARALGVTRPVVYAFLDPHNPHLPSPRLADRIEALGALHRSAGTANPLRARFEAAARRLFGDGPRFKRYDPARAEAVRRIASASGLSESAVRRNLPTFGTRARTPAEKVVEGFERAAEDLGRVA